jgi:1-phosphofructokinase family hexose kinase
MIRAICLNPLIDRSYHIPNFIPGKKYKNNPFHECIGGKGLNIAKVCSQLKEPVAVYGFLGGNTGKKILKGMKDYSEHLYFVEIEGENRITVNVIDREQNLETEIIEKGPVVTPSRVELLLSYLKQDLRKEDIVVCSGISITGAPDDIYVKISRLCELSGALCFLDTNGSIFKHSLEGAYYLGKPNHYELAELLDKSPVKEPRKLFEMTQPLLEKTFKYILISTGEQGAVLCGSNICYRAKIPKVKVISTIGSGDSALAGFAVGLSRGLPFFETFRLSMACGVSNAMEPKVANVNIEQITALKDEIRVEKII